MPVFQNRTVEYANDICGGSGQMTRDKLLVGDMLGGICTMVNCNTLEPGASIGLHPHNDDTEMYFIVDGEALYIENGTEYHLAKGDMAFCEQGSTHGITNTGDVPMAFVAVIQKPAE